MLALPYGVDPDDTEKQKQCLEKNFSKYFADKSKLAIEVPGLNYSFRLLWEPVNH